MLSMSRTCVLFSIVLAAWIFVIGTAMAAQITGNEVEALETILTYFALLSMGIIGTCIGFLRWFLKRWDPNKINPITAVMAEKLMTDTTLGPVLERIEEMEARQEKIATFLTRLDAKIDGDMGSGERFLRSGR